MKDMTDRIAEQVIEILAEQAMLDPSDVTLDASLESLGVDSLGLVETIFAIEEAFEISVPFNANAPDATDGPDLSSVGAIVRAVRGLVTEQAA